MATPSIKLTYFDIEGVAECVRLALLISSTPYEDVRIQFPEWGAIKPTTPYGQLPVMTIDNGPMLAQSKALLRLIGATYSESLYPREKLYDIENAIGLVEDFQNLFRSNFFPQKKGFPENFYDTDEGKVLKKEMREQFVAEILPKVMGFLITMLEKHDGKWLASTDEPTIADCYAIPILRSFTKGHLDYVSVNCLDKYPSIVEYIKRFCALSQVQGRYTDGLF